MELDEAPVGEGWQVDNLSLSAGRAITKRVKLVSTADALYTDQQTIKVVLVDSPSIYTITVPLVEEFDSEHHASFTVIVPDGVESMWFKTSTFLGKSIPESAFASSTVIDLVNGDVDADNVVSVFDYILLSDSFDAVPEDSNWYEFADLDRDRVVSVFDYIILSDNFDVAGDADPS